MTTDPDDSAQTDSAQTDSAQPDAAARAERQARQGREVTANFAAFKRLEPEIPAEYDGQHALLRGGAIISYHPDAVAAYHAGLDLYPDRIFSIQQVRAEPLDFGWFSQFAGVWNGHPYPDHGTDHPSD